MPEKISTPQGLQMWKVVASFDATRKNQYKKSLARKRVLADGRHQKALYVEETPGPLELPYCAQNWRVYMKDK